MDFKTSYYVKEVGVILGVALLFFAMAAESILLTGIGVLVEVLALAQALVFYRCPYCKSMFPIREKPSNFCPECGHALEQEKH